MLPQKSKRTITLAPGDGPCPIALSLGLGYITQLSSQRQSQGDARDDRGRLAKDI